MSSIVGSLWTILSSYRPNAARDAQTKKPQRFGAFETTYVPPGYATFVPDPRLTPRLYNHIRTVAFWLDAAPLLSDLGLPFRAGIDDIVSLVPIYGDIVSGLLQLYQVWLCLVFGVPRNVLVSMLFNVLLDVIIGFVPLIGDVLDNFFKSNLRNLALLEEWLLEAPAAGRYHILLMPETTDFLPKPKSARFASAWFGTGGGSSKAGAGAEAGGRVERTRRMRRDEGDAAFGQAAGVAHDPLD